MTGGFYCKRCGATYRQLPSGLVTCQRCGEMGLFGYENARPVRVPCLVEGCSEKVWDDGGVNGPSRIQHAYDRHPEPVAQGVQAVPGA